LVLAGNRNFYFVEESWQECFGLDIVFNFGLDDMDFEKQLDMLLNFFRGKTYSL